MQITSTAFLDNQNIPDKYTCDGANINPSLLINGVPEAAKSLVLLVDDPDSPSGTWVHWLVWNISPDIKEIEENSVPLGAVEGVTTFGNTGYGGPCPGSGKHHYCFKIFALDTMLDLTATSTVTDLEFAMEGHVLDKTQLVGLYQRK